MVIIGNVGKEPDVRQKDDLKTTSFSVATSEERKSKDGSVKVHTEWFRVVTYRRLAEMASTGIKKGQKVCVIGKMRSSSWDDKKTGEKRIGWSLEADDLFIHVRETSDYSGEHGDYNSNHDYGQPPQMNEDDIPF